MSLHDITSRIAKAETDAGRTPGSVELIAVSKVQPDARVAAVLSEGHRCFGENRVQEAEGKWPAFRQEFGLPAALPRRAGASDRPAAKQ